jgi:hypothetical protein
MFARRHSITFRYGLGCVVLMLVCPMAWAQLGAAKVMAVTGSAKAVDPQGIERLLEKGGVVHSGDKVVTGDGALVQMRLNDGGYLSVRSGTEMVIDRFVYDEKNASNSNFLVSLIRGGFRSITGLIGKTNPEAYQIRTSTATVGIRGTDHEPMVIPENVPAMAALGAPGFYDKVNEGETFIRNQGGILSLKRGEVGFAPVIPANAPQILQKIPDFYKVEIKTDARDPQEGANNNNNNRKAPAAGGMLRPSLAARIGTLAPDAGTVTDPPILKSPTIGTLDPVISPTQTEKTLSTTTLVAPTTTTTTDPSKLLTPTTTLISPTTSTLIAPTTTTLIAPTTTTIAPITTTTTISPKTTLIAPTTSTLILK